MHPGACGAHHVVVHGQRELIAVREHGLKGRCNQLLPLPCLFPCFRVILRDPGDELHTDIKMWLSQQLVVTPV